MIILDTNVIAAAMTPEKYPIVAAWLVTQPTVYTTSVTVMETLNGIYTLDTGKKRAALDVAADAVFAPLQAAGRVLTFDYAAAFYYATLMVKRPKPAAGEVLDAQIAAIALAHDATLATQNVKDFAGKGVKLLDPSTGTHHG
ncbi:PIN domain-containing protein [Nocardia arizonensis]|uniref:PIN domain-containing protein n=1 Tax=Nocardia arizonensis TaxID=1141647 RepID=UPI0006D14635|nr:PIN domain-containing protein [Nocardia arizonensis]